MVVAARAHVTHPKHEVAGVQPRTRDEDCKSTIRQQQPNLAARIASCLRELPAFTQPGRKLPARTQTVVRLWVGGLLLVNVRSSAGRPFLNFCAVVSWRVLIRKCAFVCVSTPLGGCLWCFSRKWAVATAACVVRRRVLKAFRRTIPATRNRTRDHLIAAEVYSQMLYQLSYSRIASQIANVLGGGQRSIVRVSAGIAEVQKCRARQWGAIGDRSRTRRTICHVCMSWRCLCTVGVPFRSQFAIIGLDANWGYGATAARLTPDQKVGSSNLSALIFEYVLGNAFVRASSAILCAKASSKMSACAAPERPRRGEPL